MFRRLGMGEKARGYLAMEAWTHAAAAHLRSHARAERLRGGVLFIRVVSASWAQQLSFLKAELLDRLHDEPGGDTITELRFSVGPLDDIPAFDTPRDPPRVSRPPNPPRVAEPDARAALATVADAELRDILARILRRA